MPWSDFFPEATHLPPLAVRRAVADRIIADITDEDSPAPTFGWSTDRALLILECMSGDPHVRGRGCLRFELREFDPQGEEMSVNQFRNLFQVFVYAGRPAGGKEVL